MILYRRLCFAIAFWAGFMVLSSCSERTQAGKETFLKLWYEQPALQWTEALPVGNGRIGAMVFGGVDTARYQLNDATLWSGYPRDGNNPGAQKTLPEVRKALFSGDYSRAELLCRQMMGPYVATYLTLGDLELCFEDSAMPVTNYRRSLNLENAVASLRYEKEGSHFSREAFSSYPDQILVIHLKAGGPRKLNFTTRFTNPMPHRVLAESNNRVILEGVAPAYVAHRPYEEQQFIYDSSRGMRFAVGVQASVVGGAVDSDSGGLMIREADEVTLYISTGTSYRGFNQMPAEDPGLALETVHNRLDTAAGYSARELLSRHEKDYRQLFDRVRLDLGEDSAVYRPTDVRLKEYTKTGGYSDPQLTALLFQYGRYLMISASRPSPEGGSFPGQPMNLQGIWNNSMRPPWSSNYTTNINTEMNYWPAEADNLSECAGPLFHFIQSLAERGARTAQVNYGSTGWVAHHNSDIWAQTAPPGNYGKDPQATPQWAMWPMGGAWLTRHLWEHYLYTGDRNFLEQMTYPAMQGAARFMLHWLIPYKDYLVTAPSTSPEHNFVIDGHAYSVSIASTMDMSIIRDLFSNTIAASETLGADEQFRDSLKQALGKLYPFHIGRYGQLQEWYKDWDDPEDHHRHISHLYGLFPAGIISIRRTPELAAAARKSLELRGDGGTGWSKAWKINCWARLGDGDHAYKMLNEQLFLAGQREGGGDTRGGSYPNLFDAHPPFQIDGNFGFTSGVTEMLMQSQDGFIDLLPALPAIWKNGSTGGLKARGGFEVDMNWNAGKPERVKIYSALGGNCRIRSHYPLAAENNLKLVEASGKNPNPFYALPEAEPPFVAGDSSLKIPNIPESYLYDLATQPGKTYLLKGL